MDRALVLLLAVAGVATAVHHAHATASASATLWNGENCREGNVTDLVCCRDDHCGKLADKDTCDKEKTCLWTKGAKGDDYACKPNRDADNNVCCLSKVSEYCSTIIDGKCPEHFQVPAGCCSEKGTTYTSVLSVDRPGYVCCNTPCKEAKNLNCSIPKQCLKTQGRSLGGDYGGVDFGFNKGLLPPNRQPYGSVIPYTGFENRYDHLPVQELSSTGDVNEITVDDLMSSLVEALSNDKDVYQYSSSTTSDPYFGKQKFGGLQGSFNYPDPKVFLNSLYGSPYGLSQGQFGFQGQGWPQVQGIFPGYGYGGGYGGGYGSGGYGQSSYGGGYGGGYGSGGYGQSSYGGGYGGQPTYAGGYGNGGYGGQSSYGNGGYGGQSSYGGGNSYGGQGSYGSSGYGQSGYGNSGSGQSNYGSQSYGQSNTPTNTYSSSQATYGKY